MWTRLRRRVGAVLRRPLLLTRGGGAAASWTATWTVPGSARAPTATPPVVGAAPPAAQVRPLSGFVVTEPTVAEVIVTGNGLGLVTVAATDPTVPEP